MSSLKSAERKRRKHSSSSSSQHSDDSDSHLKAKRRFKEAPLLVNEDKRSNGEEEKHRRSRRPNKEVGERNKRKRSASSSSSASSVSSSSSRSSSSRSSSSRSSASSQEASDQHEEEKTKIPPRVAERSTSADEIKQVVDENDRHPKRHFKEVKEDRSKRGHSEDDRDEQPPKHHSKEDRSDTGEEEQGADEEEEIRPKVRVREVERSKRSTSRNRHSDNTDDDRPRRRFQEDRPKQPDSRSRRPANEDAKRAEDERSKRRFREEKEDRSKRFDEKQDDRHSKRHFREEKEDRSRHPTEDESRHSERRFREEKDAKRSEKEDRNGIEHRHESKSRDRKRRHSRSRSNSPAERKPLKRSTNGDLPVKQEPPTVEDPKKSDARDRDTIAEELRQKQVLYQAKMQLQERILTSKGLSSSGLKTASVLKPEEAAVFADSALSSQKLQDLRKNVAAGLSRLKEIKKGAESGASPTTSAASTSMNSPLFDEKPAFELEAGAARRPVRKAFKFVEKGTYERQAQKERLQAKLSKLQHTISTTAQKTGISSAVRLAIVTPSSAEVTDDLPDIEWWDRIVLRDAQNYDKIPDQSVPADERYRSTITNLIEHPVQLKPPDAPLDNVCIKAHLTKKERKRLRRLNRREVQREQMEKIRLGLEKPPEPKVKLANLMRVLGNEAIQDPTKMEAQVRSQVEERQRKHMETNAERKLTKEERGDKKTRKIMEDTSVMVHVSVYKVLSLANPSKRFKILMNAKQLQMTGTIIGVEDMHVVVVEGGPKQQHFYKNLMMKRINWAEELVGQKKGIAKDEDEGQRNECVLVWEGVVSNRSFNNEPRLQTLPDHKSAREYFARHNVEHYWDHCFSHSVLLSSKD